MHIVVLSILVALVVCLLLLVAFALFTLTPFADDADRLRECPKQRGAPRTS